jgi:hypothetical protein
VEDKCQREVREVRESGKHYIGGGVGGYWFSAEGGGGPKS